MDLNPCLIQLDFRYLKKPIRDIHRRRKVIGDRNLPHYVKQVFLYQRAVFVIYCNVLLSIYSNSISLLQVKIIEIEILVNYN